MVSGPWLSSSGGRQAVERIGQPPLSAVCPGERQRRLPTTQGGTWPVEGYCVQRTQAAPRLARDQLVCLSGPAAGEEGTSVCTLEPA